MLNARLVRPHQDCLSIRTVDAIRHLRKMRGGSQSHLLLCSDGNHYVVKFQNNPQHIRVLANELLAGLLARPLDLPMAEVAIVRVDASLIDASAAMTISLVNSITSCHAGTQFGSQYVVKPTEGQVFDYLPSELLAKKVNDLEVFSGVLSLDKWLGNADGRQAAFFRRVRERKYNVAFIDQGYCFNGGAWAFRDDTLLGVYSTNEVYAQVKGWKSFEPFLSRIEGTRKDFVLQAAGTIPPAWYGNDWSALKTLTFELLNRTKKVRDLISQFRLSPRQPFPNWESDK